MQKDSNVLTPADRSTGSGFRLWLGIVLMAAGLSGHLFAAQAIGGYFIAYRDHIFGFVMGAIVTGVIIVLLGKRFWRGRHDITVLIIGAVQAIGGLLIYINRFNIA